MPRHGLAPAVARLAALCCALLLIAAPATARTSSKKSVYLPYTQNTTTMTVYSPRVSNLGRLIVRKDGVHSSVIVMGVAPISKDSRHYVRAMNWGHNWCGTHQKITLTWPGHGNRPTHNPNHCWVTPADGSTPYNVAVIREGFARYVQSKPLLPPALAKQLQQAEDDARRAKRGIWAD